jgi:hypothetical protein
MHTSKLRTVSTSCHVPNCTYLNMMCILRHGCVADVIRYRKYRTFAGPSSVLKSEHVCTTPNGKPARCTSETRPKLTTAEPLPATCLDQVLAWTLRRLVRRRRSSGVTIVPSRQPWSEAVPLPEYTVCIYIYVPACVFRTLRCFLIRAARTSVLQ